MRKLLFIQLFIIIIIFSCKKAGKNIENGIPHLKKDGQVVQLIVNKKPFLILGGEVENTSTTDLQHIRKTFPLLKKMNLNTVLLPVAWAWVEPEEGKFDFDLIDSLLFYARKNDLKIVFLWFGSWKNGLSNFVPSWVKLDQKRFPRVKISNGKSIEVLSPFSDSNLQADKKAYSKFLNHLKYVDRFKSTVIMIQLQNEVGILGDSRDRCEIANKAFESDVPAELISYLQKNIKTLSPQLIELWSTTNFNTKGNWEQVFGKNPFTGELFMAWYYAHYMNKMALAGKNEWPLPVITNSWIVQPEDKFPGDYPSGGPEPLNIDIWKVAAPNIDINAPDIYLPNFDEWAILFHRPDNPLFIPESKGDIYGMANAFYALGQHSALGYSPFGIDNFERFGIDINDIDKSIEKLPITIAYGTLYQLSNEIIKAQKKQNIAAVWLNSSNTSKEFVLGNYKICAQLWHNMRNPSITSDIGFGIFILTDTNEYIVSGYDITVTFTPLNEEKPIAGFLETEAIKLEKDKWMSYRKLNGDDIIVRYDLAKASEINQSGSGLIFRKFNNNIQRVRLYNYK
jgi:hypothetical protein